MSLAPRLDLRLTQSLVMTPQLQQAIKLLTLSNLEIEAVIAEEIEKNPLLTAVREDEGSVPARPEPAEDRVETDALVSGGATGGEPSLDLDYATESHQADSAADGGGGFDGSLGGAAGGAASEDGPDFDSFANPDLGLADHLMAQAGAALPAHDLFIAAHLIDQIDEAGYLTVTLLDIANRLGVPLAHVAAVLAVVQSFEPTGVGARDLAECLTLQAKEADRHDPCMQRLLANLDLLARGELARLKRICGVDDEDMADMIRELRGYDPKPGCRIGGAPMQAVVPDVFVTRIRTGWSVEVNAATLPRVLVDRRYHAELGAGANKASKAWLGDMLASANWLVKALDQRQRTIVKVATEIVKQQEAFFLHGVAHLKPMTLARVAEAIEMHESTVSRVTSNKYLSCARGLFEMKYFFTSAIQAADGGDAVSAEAVKSALRALIAGEGAAILSDDTLVDLLQAKGFDLARRTVAKYREAMGIGSSVQRRRARALEGA